MGLQQKGGAAATTNIRIMLLLGIHGPVVSVFNFQLLCNKMRLGGEDLGAERVYSMAVPASRISGAQRRHKLSVNSVALNIADVRVANNGIVPIFASH